MFNSLFGFEKLPLKKAGIVCQQLNLRLGPGKATVQVQKKNKKSRERRLKASQKVHNKIQNRM